MKKSKRLIQSFCDTSVNFESLRLNNRLMNHLHYIASNTRIEYNKEGQSYVHGVIWTFLDKYRNY